MTLAAVPRSRSAGATAAGAATLDLGRTWTVVLLGVLVGAALSWPRALVIWQDNTFFDTDDAMRLVQVRAWLAGQGWYDLVAHRLDPPAGLLMHWSRVVDVPVGALIRAFALAIGVDSGERLARIVFPLAMQAALMAVMVPLGRLLAGPRALVPTMILTVLSGYVFEQFPPGRIDHHAPQIVLLAGMTLALLSSLTPGRARHAALAAAAIAVSLAISLENLPFMAVIVAVLPLAWVARPGTARQPMAWFAAGLLVAVPAMFVATVPPARYGSAVTDVFSAIHLVAAAAGACGLLVLVALDRHLPTPARRLLTLASIAALVGAGLVTAFPGCLHGPYADMDPVLRAMWLSTVTEAQPLLTASRLRPSTFTTLGCPLFVGALALAIAAARETGLARLRWSVLLALGVVGIAGTFWEIRVAASTQPLALMGGVWAVTRAMAAAADRGPLRGLVAAALVLPFSTVAWAFVPMGDGDLIAADAMARGQTCRSSAALAPLAALPPGLIFAPIDDGAHLLVDTPHAVVAAPYHRNQAGNRRVLDGFMLPPTAAEAAVRGADARYVAICPGEVQISELQRAAPQGLAAALAGGATPDWLRPVDVGASPYRVYEVTPLGLR